MNCQFCNIQCFKFDSYGYKCKTCQSMYRKMSDSSIKLARIETFRLGVRYYIYFNETWTGWSTELYSSNTGSVITFNYLADVTPSTAKQFIDRILKLQAFK